MSYNQKAWLSILVLCSVFWLAVIGCVFSVNQVFASPCQQSLEALAAQTSHRNHANAASDHNLQVLSPTL